MVPILLLKKKCDFTFTSNTLSQDSSLVLSNIGPKVGLTATLDTRISILPQIFIVSAINLLREADVPT